MQIQNLVAVLLSPSVLASVLQINLPSHLPPLPPATHAILRTPNIPLLTTPITTRNGFVFRNLTVGSYNLDIACREYDFEKGVSVVVEEGGGVRVWRGPILIAGKVEEEMRADHEQNEGKGRGKEEVEIRVVRRREWREERGGCEFCPSPLRAEGRRLPS